jgi:hypothetical protein
VTAAVSPSSFPQSSTGRFEVSTVEARRASRLSWVARSSSFWSSAGAHTSTTAGPGPLEDSSMPRTAVELAMGRAEQKYGRQEWGGRWRFRAEWQSQPPC